MVHYEVTVFTTNFAFASTLNRIHCKLVGSEGESPRTRLISIKGPLSFTSGAVSTFRVTCPKSLGKLVLIELEKEAILFFPPDSWFPALVQADSPEGDAYYFPVHRWIDDANVHRFREGTALQVCEDSHPLGMYDRERELKMRASEYRWDVYTEGIPHCIKTESCQTLPGEVRFSFTKTSEFLLTAAAGLAELQLEGLAKCTQPWPNMDTLSQVFSSKHTEITEYVREHWKEDNFFGYQYLNGVNPMLIRRCTVLPKNFPVTDGMVYLHGQGTLAEEMKKGNIFLLDYKRFDGLPPNIINGKKHYLMAPLVLLFKTPDNWLKPIAIQLKQTPADDNPIFLPTDSEYDWLLAKIFVRSADFSEHQLNAHLLRTHLLAEVFAVSLLRNLPMVHPLYKLLVPHTRYNLQINVMARLLLISETGVFTKFAASGGDAMNEILKSSLKSMTYSSLCIQDDIAERGLEAIPNFYYRDDGLQLWNIIHKFVEGIIKHYYKDDSEVKKDSELQEWISDIFEFGFLSDASTGIPQKFTNVAELVKFVTMVIFTCSCQHAAVNGGQFDYGAWMPNTPIALQLPPPTRKGTSSEATMLNTFPDVNTTAQGMSTMWLLSKQSSDFVPLGHYPEHHFSEETPLQLIKEFQGELKVLSQAIKVRNQSLEVPYTYMDPEFVENSVAI